MKKLLLLPIIFLIVSPLISIVHTAFREFDSELWAHLYSTVMQSYITNTLFLVVGTAFFATMIGVSLSFVVSHYDFPGKSFFKWALVLPLSIPPYITGVIHKELWSYSGPMQKGLRYVFGFDSPKDYWFPEIVNIYGLMFVLSLATFPYVYILSKVVFRKQSHTYIEIGNVSGLKPLLMFRKIVLPLALPAVISGAIIVSMEVLSDYGTSVIFGIQTVAVWIYNIWFGMYKPAAAAQLSSGIMVFIVFAFFLQWLYKRKKKFSNPVSKHSSVRSVRLGRKLSAAAFMFCSFIFFISFIIPVATLILWSYSTFEHFQFDLLLSDVTNTLITSGSTAFITVFLALIFSYAVRLRKRERLLKVSVMLIHTNFAFPTIVLAVGILILSGMINRTVWGSWISGSVVILIFGFSVRFIPLAFNSIQANMLKIDRRTDDITAVLNRGKFFRLFKVYLPLLSNGMVVGSILVFIDTAKELTMSLVLQPFGYSSLALRVFYYAESELVYDSALWALCIVVLCAVPLFIVDRKLDGKM